MKESIAHYGSDLKLALKIDFGEEISADSVPFEVEFHLGGASLTLSKEQLIKVDENNYIACIKAQNTEKGRLTAYVKAQLPDMDFEDQVQNVVTPVEANIIVL